MQRYLYKLSIGELFALLIHAFGHTQRLYRYMFLLSSRKRHLRLRVPQGSVLYPVLFLLCISDLTDSITLTKITFKYHSDTIQIPLAFEWFLNGT